ncbi:uncharacterized protein FIESC28_05955 [Fusarium coffeatum]|uniref:CBM-cenC domain-containing protein n=1 Tax=Fusarium coffeatum TaxID=231269 RepID=A0A366RQ71_9HYPO|nr:uncharacterized protein FIESC28_05955 [Fusarium coffeatum]RBR18678.1 hypothetical protein FIESC28_05955 [Fusarium coffeatum]
MRFTSLCAVLGATLLPVVSAAPCKPSKPTSVVPTTSATTTAEAETLSTDTPYETLSTDFQSTVTSDATSYLETTVTESATWSETTTFVSDYTTEYTATTDATSVEDVTTTVTEAAPEPTNLIKNSDFEDQPNVDWGLRTSEIVKDEDKAASGERYVRFQVINQSARGGNSVNQTISDVEVTHRYRLSFSGAAFGLFDTGSNNCYIEAYQKGDEIQKWKLGDVLPDEYNTYSVDFTPKSDSFELALRLRCEAGDPVTITFGIDDVSMVDIGPMIKIAPPIKRGEISESDY